MLMMDKSWATVAMTEINGKWVNARPVNYKYRSLSEKIRDAWYVFIGKADALIWPEGQ